MCKVTYDVKGDFCFNHGGDFCSLCRCDFLFWRMWINGFRFFAFVSIITEIPCQSTLHSIHSFISIKSWTSQQKSPVWTARPCMSIFEIKYVISDEFLLAQNKAIGMWQTEPTNGNSARSAERNWTRKTGTLKIKKMSNIRDDCSTFKVSLIVFEPLEKFEVFELERGGS